MFRVGAFKELLFQRSCGSFLQMTKANLRLLDSLGSCLSLFSEHWFVNFFAPGQATAISTSITQWMRGQRKHIGQWGIRA